ncbi:aminotransferase class IV [Halococcoides cellulosivorans]|uniref:4-amino-4-deoxychorismate lyase n=1 Tax=Halococcoides cellulosivorans TaxID=1679096 RepID=A0A2R4WZ97_9EURY|nr:aminotransferase class IV [Halococcoides cellulosivorans]AWB26869.1 4-amino-4-deoxychorismate lyase [Halococcoides cellulosivorans]
MTCYLDGRLVPEDRATVSVRDRGFRYGDAIYETVRLYDGAIDAWPAHAARLERSLAALGIAIERTPADLRAAIRATALANDARDGAARLSITRGADSGRLTPTESDPTVVVTATPLDRGGLGAEWPEFASAVIVDRQRIPDAARPSHAKVAASVTDVLARREARDRGADEALLQDATGRVVEGATSNLFVVRSDQVVTPPLAGPILPGVTRQQVCDLCADLGLDLLTRAPTPEECRDADEAFLTNATQAIRPIDRIDDRPIEAPGPITRRLARAFDAGIEARHYRSED